MSRIGETAIDVPQGVTVGVEGATVTARGGKGELSVCFPDSIGVELAGQSIKVSRADDKRKTRSLHGLFRSLIANMVDGVANGFTRELLIEGVGFRGDVQGNKLTMSLGFSRPIEYVVPEGVSVAVQGGTNIVVSGPDKQKVGQVAARIRSFFPAEPYKGKGVRYRDEHVRRKVGKTVA